MIELQPVESGLIDSAAYDAEAQVAYIKLQAPTVYTYSSFPQAAWDAFMAAPSKATYFRNQIRGKYATGKL